MSQTPPTYLPVVADHLEWKVEVCGESLEHPDLVEFKEVYASEFGIHTPHMNFCATESNGKGFCIFSIQKNPTGEFPKTSSIVILGPTYKALLTDAEGYEEFYIHNVPLQKGGTDPLPVFEEFLNNRLMKKEVKIYGVTQKAFVREMIALEQKFSRRLKTMKIAVLYIEPGQTNVKEEIFKNQPPENSRFFKFMEQIAERKDMKNWKGYRGDMGKDGDDVSKDSFYTSWKGREVMFHIAPYMNAEQHRRLVGNDIAVLIYFDNQKPDKHQLQLFGGSEIGIVPHVFTVVEPHPSDNNKYRIASFSRQGVPSYKPATPPPQTYIKMKYLKDFLMTKLHNGLAAAQSVAPMNRLYTVPRREAIKDLVDRYPKKNQGIVKTEKGSGTLNKLKVHLIQGKDLASKDSNGLSDPYCRVIVGDIEVKSQIKKKTLKPQWNESFEFDLDDDFALEEFHIICMDWDKVGSHDYMGEHRVLLKDLPINEPVWLPLLGTTTEEVSGQIQLEFDLISLTEEDERRKKGTAIKSLGKKKNKLLVNTSSGANPVLKSQEGLSKIQSVQLTPTDPNTPDSSRKMKASKSSDNVRSKINHNLKKSDPKNNNLDLVASPGHKHEYSNTTPTISPRQESHTPIPSNVPHSLGNAPNSSPNTVDVPRRKWMPRIVGQEDESVQRRSYSIGAVTGRTSVGKVKKVSHSKDSPIGHVTAVKQEVEAVWTVCLSHEVSKDALLAKGHTLKQLLVSLRSDCIEYEPHKQSIMEVVESTTNFLRLCLAFAKHKIDNYDPSSTPPVGINDIQKPLGTALQTCQNSILSCLNNLQIEQIN